MHQGGDARDRTPSPRRGSPGISSGGANDPWAALGQWHDNWWDDRCHPCRRWADWVEDETLSSLPPSHLPRPWVPGASGGTQDVWKGSPRASLRCESSGDPNPVDRSMCDGPCGRWVGEECYIVYGQDEVYCLDCRPPPAPPTRPPPKSPPATARVASAAVPAAHAAGTVPKWGGAVPRPAAIIGGGGSFGPSLPISQTAIALAKACGRSFGRGDRSGGGCGSPTGPFAPPIAAWRRVVQRAVASESSRSGADRIDNLYGLLRDCWRVDRDGTRPAVPRHLCDQFWAEVAVAKEQRRARDQLTLAQRRTS